MAVAAAGAATDCTREAGKDSTCATTALEVAAGCERECGGSVYADTGEEREEAEVARQREFMRDCGDCGEADGDQLLLGDVGRAAAAP